MPIHGVAKIELEIAGHLARIDVFNLSGQAVVRFFVPIEVEESRKVIG